MKIIEKNYQKILSYLSRLNTHNHPYRKIKKIIDKEFKTHPGDVKDFWIGTERKDARSTLRNFINFKLNLFGDYEDPVDERDNILFHMH